MIKSTSPNNKHFITKFYTKIHAKLWRQFIQGANKSETMYFCPNLYNTLWTKLQYT